ncbi:N(G),N(G)-dimethylarginine dimethylaminohydrolase [Candidatus Saccharibacteria bacterium]|nr:MAG: N(G),N(G)-dimethylarginine dimethylaminohydrolase [Candidatus Saccharibacteria bacterium]
MFSHAIVRRPSHSLIDGISQTPEKGKPDYQKALEQHDKYVELLRKLGLEVTVLEANEQFPDSVFIEDNALCTPHGVAILSCPGAESRRGESELPDLRQALEAHYENIEQVVGPGTVDPGDIMMVGDHYYIGLSHRTNQAAADQILDILQRYGMTGETVEVSGILHLKDDVVYLDNNRLIVAKAYENHPAFADFEKIVVDDDEYYAVNSLWINGTVIVPEGFPKTEEKNVTEVLKK